MAEEKPAEPEVKETLVEETVEGEKDVIEGAPKEEIETPKAQIEIPGWTPKTTLGLSVKAGDITDIDQILDKGIKILEQEIVDTLLPGMESELLMIGQSKGKFGGGARRIFKQTQKKTPEGNKPSFSCAAVVGNKDGYVGGGMGKSRDTVPSREKALRRAKLNIMKIRRGCGSWECGCREPHSIPFKVSGKEGSVRIELMPAPKGKGLVVEPECQKILRLAGIKDVWSKTYGQTKITTNLARACLKALRQLMEIKIRPDAIEKVGMIEGRVAE